MQRAHGLAGAPFSLSSAIALVTQAVTPGLG
jgi:hypothetical protein